MPPTHRRPPRHTARSARGLFVLGSLLVGGLLPAGTSAASPARTEAPTSSRPPILQPTVQYEEALAHAADRIHFEPGARVRFAFVPRPGDRWSVGGIRPRSLPAGRLSGSAMRMAGGYHPSPIDLPSVAPRDSLDATTGDPLTDARRFEPAAAVDPGALRREVFGFLPYWELTDTSTRLDWDKLSTVAYFGVGADRTGALQKANNDGSTTVGWSGWTSSKMTSVIDAAHKHHARVVLTVQSFAWSSSGLARQKALLRSPSARSRLAHQIATAIRDRGADGVNLDFEPIAAGYADEFTALVRKVRAVLDATAPGYQLTFDTTGWIGNYPIEDATAKGGADAVFVMGYDYRSSNSGTVGSIAPIGGPTYDVADTIRTYLDRVPASKLILGVPYYGRAWSASSSQLGAKNISGSKYGPSASVTYTTARAFAAKYGRQFDTTEGVSWTAYKRKNCTTKYGCVTPWRQLYYDDVRALKAKYDLVNGYDLRGIGIWALGYDGTRTELYGAIEDKFITDTVPPRISAGALSAAIFSPDGDGTLDTTTAKLTVTGLIAWGYAVQPVKGDKVSAAIRKGGATGRLPTFTWDGRDDDGARVKDGTYRITLWAADISDNRAERAFTVVLDTRSPTVTSAASLGFFSPDGDRHNDTLPLSWAATERLTGSAHLRDRTGRTVRSWTVKQAASWAATWTGADTHGAIVADGIYTFRVDGRDAAGNRTIVDRTVLVDRTIRSVRWSAASFDPRGKETTRAEVALRRAAKLTVAIYQGNVLVRKVWTNKVVKVGSIRWTWDGRDGKGKQVKAGTYRIVVGATSKFGTTRYSKGVTVEAH